MPPALLSPVLLFSLVLLAGCSDGDGNTHAATAQAPSTVLTLTSTTAKAPRPQNRYPYKLVGETAVLGPRATGPENKVTTWGVYFRTNKRLPITTSYARDRYKIRLSTLEGRTLQSSEPLGRLKANGNWCYEALLDARQISPLYALDVGDRVRVSLELLRSLRDETGKPLARPRTLTVRASGRGPANTRAALKRLGCYSDRG